MAIPTWGTNAVDWEERVPMDRLRDGAARPAAGAAQGLGLRRDPRVRLRQHPLHDGDPHRHVGDRQADPVRAADPQLRPDPLGLRLGGQAPRALQPVAEHDDGRDGRRSARPAPRRRATAARARLARRDLDPARGVQPRTPGSPTRSRARSSASSRSSGSPASRSASTSSSCRSCSRCRRPASRWWTVSRSSCRLARSRPATRSRS